MLERDVGIGACLSVRQSVRPSRANIESKLVTV